jgi:hypothetical protein
MWIHPSVAVSSLRVIIGFVVGDQSQGQDQGLIPVVPGCMVLTVAPADREVIAWLHPVTLVAW